MDWDSRPRRHEQVGVKLLGPCHGRRPEPRLRPALDANHDHL